MEDLASQVGRVKVNFYKLPSSKITPRSRIRKSTSKINRKYTLSYIAGIYSRLSY